MFECIEKRRVILKVFLPFYLLNLTLQRLSSSILTKTQKNLNDAPCTLELQEQERIQL